MYTPTKQNTVRGMTMIRRTDSERAPGNMTIRINAEAAIKTPARPDVIARRGDLLRLVKTEKAGRTDPVVGVV